MSKMEMVTMQVSSDDPLDFSTYMPSVHGPRTLAWS